MAALAGVGHVEASSIFLKKWCEIFHTRKLYITCSKTFLPGSRNERSALVLGTSCQNEVEVDEVAGKKRRLRVPPIAILDAPTLE